MHAVQRGTTVAMLKAESYRRIPRRHRATTLLWPIETTQPLPYAPPSLQSAALARPPPRPHLSNDIQNHHHHNEPASPRTFLLL